MSSKKHIFLMIIFALLSIKIVSAQDGQTDTVYFPGGQIDTPKHPKYPGGSEALMKDVAKNFKVPHEAKGLHGKIIIEFTVSKTGDIIDPVIIKSLRDDVDQAALKMLKKLKKFEPAIQMGRPVSFKYTLPLKL